MMGDMPFRVKLFEFLMAPAIAWAHLCGFICGVKYDPRVDVENED